MSNITSPGRKVREHLEKGGIAMSVSAHDALTAKLVQKAGFEMISISGNAVAASYLGMPDMGFITLPEIVDVSRRIAAAVEIAVMVDADWFKDVNDRLSHAVGDEVLRRLARIIVDNCRAVDAVGRWGGEEFLILLVEAPSPGAAGVCEKIRCAVEDYFWDEVATGLRVTVSLGYAVLTPEIETPEALVHSADAALYRAKAAGRNCVRA